MPMKLPVADSSPSLVLVLPFEAVVVPCPLVVLHPLPPNPQGAAPVLGTHVIAVYGISISLISSPPFSVLA